MYIIVNVDVDVDVDVYVGAAPDIFILSTRYCRPPQLMRICTEGEKGVCYYLECAFYIIIFYSRSLHYFKYYLLLYVCTMYNVHIHVAILVWLPTTPRTINLLLLLLAADSFSFACVSVSSIVYVCVFVRK